MKTLLAALMCMVFNATQCFAISGGPFGGGGGQVSVTGTYAGVLVPIQVEVAPGPPPVFLPPDNSLVLFTLRVPNTGLADGTSAVFRNGYFYSGTVQGSADPDTAKLTGIVAAEFSQDVESGTTTITAHLEANGQFTNAKITADVNQIALARIRGKASLTYALGANGDALPGAGMGGVSGGPIQYKIKGFKQSQSVI